MVEPLEGNGSEEKLCSDLTEETFTPHDVVLGKGNGINCLPGNQMFRSIINKYKTLYAKTPRNVKGSVAELVINEIARLEPPGRFLEPQADNKRFKEVPRKRAIEKTCQALREKKNQTPPSSSQQQQTVVNGVARKVSLTATSASSDPHATEPTSFLPQQTSFVDLPSSTEPNTSTKPPPSGEGLPDTPQNLQHSSQTMEDMEQSTSVPHVDDSVEPQSRELPAITQSLPHDDQEDNVNQNREPMDVSDSIEELASPDDNQTDSKPVWPLMENDVLYGGRGRKHFHRVANQRFLDLIKYSRQEYQASRSKKRVALGIIMQWRRQAPPGRFLQQNSKDNKWYEIAQSKILEKTCQALRDLKRERGPGGVRPTIADRMVDPRMEPALPPHQQQHQQQQTHPQMIHPNAPPTQHPNMHLFPPHPHALPPHAHWNLPPPHQAGRYPPQGMMYGNSYMPHPPMPHSSAPVVGPNNNSTALNDSNMAPTPIMYNHGYGPPPPGAPVAAPSCQPLSNHNKSIPAVTYGNSFPPQPPLRAPSPGPNSVPSHTTGGHPNQNATDRTDRNPTHNMMYGNGFESQRPPMGDNRGTTTGVPDSGKSETNPSPPVAYGGNFIPLPHPPQPTPLNGGNAAAAPGMPPTNDKAGRENPPAPALMYGNNGFMPVPQHPHASPGHHVRPTQNMARPTEAATAGAPPENEKNGGGSESKQSPGMMVYENCFMPQGQPAEAGSTTPAPGSSTTNNNMNDTNTASMPSLEVNDKTSTQQPQTSGNHSPTQQQPPHQQAAVQQQPTNHHPNTSQQPPHHHDPAAVAAIQRQASIVAQEMQKMDEMVRRASSSGVYVPPGGFGPPQPPPSSTPQPAADSGHPPAKSTEPASAANDTSTSTAPTTMGSTEQVSTEPDGQLNSSPTSNSDLGHSTASASNGAIDIAPRPPPPVADSSQPDESKETVSEMTDPKLQGATSCETEFASKNETTNNDIPAAEQVAVKDDDHDEAVDTAKSSETKTTIVPDSPETKRDTAEDCAEEMTGTKREPASATAPTAAKEGSSPDKDKKGGDPRIRGELEAAALLANMFGT